MRRLRLVVIVLSAGTLLFVVACRQQTVADTRAADERAIRDVDAACLKAAQAKDVAGAVSCYADDASWLPPNASIAVGKEAIRAGWAQLLTTPGFSINWRITKAEVSRAGDLAYTLYSYELTVRGADGKPMSDRGKDMAVWKKLPDGRWRIVADTYNSDLPPAAPATH